MRIYVLATTKYFIASFVIAYTLLAYALLKIRRENVKTALEITQSFLMMGFMGISYITLAISYRNLQYLLFGTAQIAVLTLAVFLHRFLYTKANHLLFNNICMLIASGLVILTRLSVGLAIRQFVIGASGILAALLLPLLRKNFRYLKKPGYVYAFAGLFALSAVLLLGTATNGSYITFKLFGVTFQPSEFVKLLYVFFLSSAFSKEQDRTRRLFIGGCAMAHVMVLVLSRDLGSAIIFFVVYVLTAYLATGYSIYLLFGAVSGISGSLICYLLFSHIRTRVQAFLDPWSVIETKGYQIAQSLFAISYGGLSGCGLTQGAAPMIPFVESDFIFAPIAEEMGLLVGVCVILLCLNCFALIMKLALNSGDRFFRLFAFGTAVTYIFQTFLTIAGEGKFIPLTGVTLPLVSYGGSSILATIFMFTFVEIIYMLQEERLEEFERKYRLEEFERRYQAEKKKREKLIREKTAGKPDVKEKRRTEPLSGGAGEREMPSPERKAVTPEKDLQEEQKTELSPGKSREINWEPDEDFTLSDFQEVIYDPMIEDVMISEKPEKAEQDG